MSTYFELPARPDGAFDPRDVATSCIESGARAMLADHGALPPAFFDLSNGVAGELLHRFSVYGIRLAAVVPDPAAYSGPFQDFLRESNRGKQFRFFPTREEAIRWLESAEG